MSKQVVILHKNSETVAVPYKQNFLLLNIYRGIPGQKYNTETKRWEFPKSKLVELTTKLEKVGYTFMVYTELESDQVFLSTTPEHICLVKPIPYKLFEELKSQSLIQEEEASPDYKIKWQQVHEVFVACNKLGIKMYSA